MMSALAEETGTAHLVVSRGSTAACRHAAKTQDPTRTRLLGVTTDGDPDAVVDTWTRHATQPPVATGIVCVPGLTRSAAASPSEEALPLGGAISMRTVEEPTDYGDIGAAVGEFLAEWRDAAETTVLCFDSLTPILDAADVETVFRFLHTVTRRVTATGGVAYFHAATVDTETLDTLRLLFDTVQVADRGYS